MLRQSVLTLSQCVGWYRVVDFDLRKVLVSTSLLLDENYTVFVLTHKLTKQDCFDMSQRLVTCLNVTWRNVTCLKSSDRTVTFTCELIGNINILHSVGLLPLEGRSFRDLLEATDFLYFSGVVTFGSLRYATHKIYASFNWRTNEKKRPLYVWWKAYNSSDCLREVVMGLSHKGNTCNLWRTGRWPFGIYRGKSNKANNHLNCNTSA